jgi:hypothetical protein
MSAHELREVAVQRAHGRADAHVVVVEDDEQVGLGHACVVERLESHARGHGAVADHGHAVALHALEFGRDRHAQRRRDAGARMRGAESVVAAFAAQRKARDAAELAQRGHALAPAREDFVRVGLVPHVPHQTIVRRVEDVVQRDGQLHRAEVGAQVPTGLGDAVEHEGAQFGGQAFELRARQAAQVGRVVDGLQQSVG